MRYSTYNAIPQYPKSKKHPYENLAKQGIPGQNKEKQNNDKSTLYLPRQVTKIVLKTFENQGFFQNPT